MSSALTIAREEATEAMDMYLGIQRELDGLRGNHAKCLLELNELKAGRSREQDAARSAIDALTEATLKRADIEGHYDIVLCELIEFKVRCANLGEDLDMERLKVTNLRTRMLSYSERVAALEVQLSTRIF